MEEKRVSVVVPTRNRPDQIGPCAASILANQSPAFELIIVDQSDDDASKKAIASYSQDTRLRYEASNSRGAAAARNVGIELARSPLIAFTDDDCRVPVDWVAQIARVFDADQAAGVLFGRVAIPDELKGTGFAADYEPSQPEYQGSYPKATDTWGIAANMSVRRSVFDRVGVFDALLGPGATFKAGEEVDFAIRAIAAGAKVVNPAEVTLLHLGVRSGDAARGLLLGYLFATGAVFTKHLRLGTPGAVSLFANFFALHARHAVDSVVRGRRPTGIGAILSLLSGASKSLRYPLDREHQVYAPAAPKHPGA
jgi:glycosyltransferase involved in cell wall biosynthesis